MQLDLSSTTAKAHAARGPGRKMAGWLRLRLVWFLFSRGRPVGGSSFRSKGDEKDKERSQMGGLAGVDRRRMDRIAVITATSSDGVSGFWGPNCRLVSVVSGGWTG